MQESNRQWHPAYIKAEIHIRGLTMKQLAEKAGLNEAAVREALCRPSKSGEVVISQCLGVPLHELWPERWTEDGRRITPRKNTQKVCISVIS